MKIGLVQFSPAWEDLEKSKSSVDKLISEFNDDVDLLIFPEMSLTGYTMKSEVFAEELDGISTQYFMNLATKLKMNVIAGIIERNEEKIFNTAVHFNEDGLLMARYRKIHPFSYAKENKYYDATKEIVSTKIDKVKIGLTVCYDLRFPELYRLYGKERVDILVNIANWPVPRIDHWNHLLKARAIENICYSVGVNRVGNDPYNEYPGRSAVYSPSGDEILSCDNSENIFIAEIDLAIVNELRNKFKFLDDIKLL